MTSARPTRHGRHPSHGTHPLGRAMTCKGPQPPTTAISGALRVFPARCAPDGPGSDPLADLQLEPDALAARQQVGAPAVRQVVDHLEPAPALGDRQRLRQDHARQRP